MTYAREMYVYLLRDFALLFQTSELEAYVGYTFVNMASVTHACKEGRETEWCTVFWNLYVELCGVRMVFFLLIDIAIAVLNAEDGIRIVMPNGVAADSVHYWCRLHERSSVAYYSRMFRIELRYLGMDEIL